MQNYLLLREGMWVKSDILGRSKTKKNEEDVLKKKRVQIELHFREESIPKSKKAIEFCTSLIASCTSQFFKNSNLSLLSFSNPLLPFFLFFLPQSVQVQPPTPFSYFFSNSILLLNSTQLFFLELAFLFWVSNLFPEQAFCKGINTLTKPLFQKEKSYAKLFL